MTLTTWQRCNATMKIEHSAVLDQIKECIRLCPRIPKIRSPKVAIEYLSFLTQQGWKLFLKSPCVT